MPRQHQTDIPRLGMFEDIGEGFLSDPEQGGFYIRGHSRGFPEYLEIHGDAIALAPLRRERLDRGEQAQIIEGDRAQIGRDFVDLAADTTGELLKPLNLLPKLAGTPHFCESFQTLETERQSRDGLTDLIMQLARDPALLRFLGRR